MEIAGKNGSEPVLRLEADSGLHGDGAGVLAKSAKAAGALGPEKSWTHLAANKPAKATPKGFGEG
jgi:hypothetical protein